MKKSLMFIVSVMLCCAFITGCGDNQKDDNVISESSGYNIFKDENLWVTKQLR